MVLSSPIFVYAFLPLVLIGYFLIKDQYKNIFLVIASFLFYAWGEPTLVLLLILNIIFNYFMALAIEKRRSKIYLIISIAFNLGILFYCKYLNFCVDSFNSIFGSSISTLKVVLPLGISFYTFKAVSYILDVYLGTSKAQTNIVNVALYISFFPQVTMGPIARFSSFETQFGNKKCNIEHFSMGVQRFIIGLAKKVIVANIIGGFVDQIYMMDRWDRTVIGAWVGAIAYLIQLYYDFSGYSDMAIGISNMLGFECPENFNYPYISKTIGEYWRRWHITLGEWFKNYMYMPMFRFMMLKEKYSTRVCDLVSLLVVWIFTGMWHGAGTKFLVYGLYYYCFIAMERFRQEKKKRRNKELKIKKAKETKTEMVFSHIYVLLAVLIGQIIFRADTLPQAYEYVLGMIGINGVAVITPKILFMIKEYVILGGISLIGLAPVLPMVVKKLRSKEIGEKIYNICTPVIYIGLFVIAVSFMMTDTYKSFIYFKF